MAVAVAVINIESLVSEFLQADADMIPLVAGRVYTAVPNDKTFPLVRVTQFDDVKVTQRPLWVIRYTLQIEAWASQNYEAWNVAATAQEVLAERLEGVHTLGHASAWGTVTGVQFGSLRNAPDTDFAPSKPRRLFTAQITAHP